MPPTRAGATSRSGGRSTAATIQTAFRDVTNSYLNANKENIPPAYLGSGSSSGAAFLDDYRRDGGNGDSHVCSTHVRSRGRGSQLRDTGLCGTPVQRDQTRAGSESISCTVDSVANEPGFGASYLAEPVGTLSRSDHGTGAAAAQSALSPMMTPRGWASGGCGVTTESNGDDSSLSVLRTPGHNSAHPSAYGNGSTACKLIQQRQCALNAPRSTDAFTVAATPNQTRQRLFRVAKAASLISPPHEPSSNAGTTPSARMTGVQGDNVSNTQLRSQSALLCTPNGDRLSAVTAAVTAAALGTRASLDTPTRMEDIPLFFNNSFESGSESMTGEAPAGAGYGASQLTPYRTYDLQVAVEEMLRNCLDGFTPAKNSDASVGTPHGCPRPPPPPQTAATRTASLDAPVTLEPLFPSPTTDLAGRAGLPVWPHAMMGASMPGCTPERLTAPQGAFAENDEEDASSTPQSDRTLRRVPFGGVRRDPMVYFSTTPGAASGNSGNRSGVTHHDDAGGEFTDKLSAGFGAGGVPGESPPSSYSSDACSGFGLRCCNESCSQLDMLTMLAAAVQQQRPQNLDHNSATRPQSTCSTMESVELRSRTFSECNDATAAQQQSMPPPPPPPSPSYPIAVRHSVSPHPRVDAHSDFSSASTDPVAPQRLPSTRRSRHHISQVKAAAGSLIAVGGRRVPVDKLHLLSIGNEPPVSVPAPVTGKAAAASSSRGGQTGRALPQSAALNHVERPSMRRVPNPSSVTVTRTLSAALEEAEVPVPPPARNASAATHRFEAKPSPSYASVLESEAARVAVAGPSARRVPPAMTALLRYGGGGAVAALRPVVDGEGVQQSSEADVVAVLQFSKGQRMCFLANLSAAALAQARSTITRHRTRSKLSTTATAHSLLASRALLTNVEVGKTYLAHVYAEGSPHEGVSYEDSGVCVQLITRTSSHYVSHIGSVNGILLRVVDFSMHDEDRRQHERVLLQQTTAYIECERHLKFSGLPLKLESIYFTFDGNVCVVFYRVLTLDGKDVSQSSFTPHRHPSISRLVRELQLHLNCRVFLKCTLTHTHTHTRRKQKKKNTHTGRRGRGRGSRDAFLRE
ncbi:hypothetical protein JKF63_02935 [Porcisia hertigi]|uniref:PSP1 C-terminal domain-containing protein n=1 Tax=Porcisia hertigi TaxID=2761500 RepID=A0A836L540_9TRYP|nr:hypothetical protein JKF63_02935 [Porcisia hertigi]